LIASLMCIGAKPTTLATRAVQDLATVHDTDAELTEGKIVPELLA